MKLLILALAVSAVYASTFQVGLNFKPSQDKRQLYSSKLFHHVQMSRIFPDSKTFVDMHMKRDEKTILLAFDELLAKTNERPTKEQLTDFISYNFDSESGLESWRPSDFVSEPGFLNSIKDSQLKLFARNVYSMLPTFGRKMTPAVFRNPEQFSMIPVHNGFIVPGGNSKEFNYMESYWIIESLLISGMKETAKGMISNFIELQREFGYIPSGDRRRTTLNS
ncbi:trehalase-like [Aricia agestis]|uniref:trehalase-like n=1 Tax=Aricia agestis TaxID=91739 RepID=UPI001C207058|nr:trehalase-like [Aricia agestis]